MHARLQSKVEYHQLDIFDLTPERVGRFDVVLFMGVLYHLKHPLLALERVCALTTDLAAVDSFILREEHRPGLDVAHRAVMEFYETNEMGDQTDNWVGPSLECLLAFCRTAGFARVELLNVIEHSACVACRRKWLPPADDAPAGPELRGTFHYDNNGLNFESHHDSYVAVWFDWPSPIERQDVRPAVDEYGVRPLDLVRMGESAWQSNFRLPPGLTAGWHDVTVRIGESKPSNAQRIAVDLPVVVTSPIEVESVCDAITFAKNRLERGRGQWLSLWVAGMPENADRNNVRVFLDGRRLKVQHVTSGGTEVRQVNVAVPPEVSNGVAHIGIEIGGRRSDVVEVEIG